MQRLANIDPVQATGKTKQIFDTLQKNLGMVPNLMRTLANSPAALDAYMSFMGALAEGSLSAKLRGQIAIAVANANACDYCLSAHSVLGSKAGLSSSEIDRAKSNDSEDGKSAAALAFAAKVVRERGSVSDEDLAALRQAGFGDGEIAEIVANVALNIFTNYFNHIAATEIDFPVVRATAA